MIYPLEKKTRSHFYGNGQADPLRSDITLQSLEAKSVRLMALAQIHNCLVVNLSKLPESRLLFPRTSITKLLKKIDKKKSLYLQDLKLNSKFIKRALALEGELAYMVPSGKYWESKEEFDRSKLSEIDTLWLKSSPKLN
jgi:hypothetical protein